MVELVNFKWKRFEHVNFKWKKFELECSSWRLVEHVNFKWKRFELECSSWDSSSRDGLNMYISNARWFEWKMF